MLCFTRAEILQRSIRGLVALTKNRERPWSKQRSGESERDWAIAGGANKREEKPAMTVRERRDDDADGRWEAETAEMARFNDILRRS